MFVVVETYIRARRASKGSTTITLGGARPQRHVVNQLAAEAVAAAAYLRAPIEVKVDSHLLRAAAYAEKVAYRVV